MSCSCKSSIPIAIGSSVRFLASESSSELLCKGILKPAMMSSEFLFCSWIGSCTPFNEAFSKKSLLSKSDRIDKSALKVSICSDWFSFCSEMFSMVNRPVKKLRSIFSIFAGACVCSLSHTLKLHWAMVGKMLKAMTKNVKNPINQGDFL